MTAKVHIVLLDSFRGRRLTSPDNNEIEPKGVTIAILDEILTSGAHVSAMRQRLFTLFPD